MLDAKDFKKVAGGGFGDPHNSHAWSMEWFKGRLYVGTSRDILWLFKKIGNYPFLDPYPVPLPPLAQMDLRAQIWRYTPEADSWERVYTSPLTTPSLRRPARRPAGTFPGRRLMDAPRLFRLLRRQGRHRKARVLMRGLLSVGLEWVRSGFRIQVARDIGYRNMVVYTDTHGTEALYVVSFGPGGSLLRTLDGTTFEAVRSPRVSFRPAVSFRGRLYASPVGAYFSPYPVVLEADDPARESMDPAVWRPVSAPGFGDPDNVSIAEMAVFQDHLYAGTGNFNGFQVWKTDATGSPPYRWQQVVKDGGYKGPAGPFTAVSMYPFGEWLYVGSGRAPSALETFEPIPGELIRIAPDDTWEVVVGARRESYQGCKAPISDMPPLFGNPFAMYVWRMEAHQGWLYAGINDATTLLRYTPWNRVGPHAARWVDQHGGVDKFVEAEGGFDLWRTQDGIYWTCVTRTGFGNPLNNGVRALKSTPFGLFVGSMNFFTEAKDPITGELRGGTEIWLGAL
jgi:hypothetical protein